MLTLLPVFMHFPIATSTYRHDHVPFSTALSAFHSKRLFTSISPVDLYPLSKWPLWFGFPSIWLPREKREECCGGSEGRRCVEGRSSPTSFRRARGRDGWPPTTSGRTRRMNMEWRRGRSRWRRDGPAVAIAVLWRRRTTTSRRISCSSRRTTRMTSSTSSPSLSLREVPLLE